METKEKKKKKLKSIKHYIIFFLILAVILFAVFLVGKILNTDWNNKKDEMVDLADEVIIGEEGKVSTISQSALEKIFETSDLSTADYIYNAIVTCYAEDGEEIKYYVAYEGTVKAGIDFSKIIIIVDEEEKVIELKLPKSEIQDTIVDFGSMDYIFVDARAESETVSQEAYKLCRTDLEERAKQDEQLLDFADENARDVVEALVMTWVYQVDPEYQVEIK